jgi:hypothetical protein
VTSSLVVGPLQAYRCWHVNWEGDQAVLRSVYNPTIWPADAPLRATCMKGPGSFAAWVRGLLSRAAKPSTHPAPAWGCQCGVYGLNRLKGDELEAVPGVSGRDPDRGAVALGLVLLWGRVIQHTSGYRAEYARPLKLLMVPPQRHAGRVNTLLDAVAQRYEIQIVTRAQELV